MYIVTPRMLGLRGPCDLGIGMRYYGCSLIPLASRLTLGALSMAKKKKNDGTTFWQILF